MPKIPNSLFTLFQKDISKFPYMLHGTSLEAVSHLTNNGVLPPSDNPQIIGDFYFTPISRNFRRSDYYIPLKGNYTKRQALRSTRGYAWMNARTHYLRKYLGYEPSWFYDAVDTKPNFVEFFVEDESLTRNEAVELVDLLWKLKGFIIEPNERIFRFNYKQGDDPTTLAVHCPRGLLQDCIQTIFPLGETEREFIRRLC